MADLKAILNYYIRRNRRLKDRGRDVFSIRDSIFAISTVRNDSKRQRDKRLKELVDAGKAHWVTVKGTPICIGNASGKIVGGPKKFVGKTRTEAFSGEEIQEIEAQEKAAAQKAEEERKAKEEQERKAKEEQERKEKLHKDRLYRGTLTGEQIEKTQKNNMKLSDKGKNGSCGGFRITDKKDYLAIHVKEHGEEPDFKGMTPDEYEAAAVEFLRQPCSGSVMGGLKKEKMPDGTLVHSVIRYDRKTGLFAKGYPGGYVKTFMKAKYFYTDESGQRVYDPNWREKGYQYFLKEMQTA